MAGSPTRTYTRKKTRKTLANLTEKDSGLVMIVNRSSDMELDNGLGDNTPIIETDNLGYDTKTGNNFSSRQPTVTLTFSGNNLDIVALSIDRKTENVIANLRYPARQQIRRAIYNPATTGRLGFAVKKNADTQASYQDAQTGETRILTQQSFDSFNPLIPRSFSVGEHFERRYSNDLVNDNSWVVLQPSADYAARALAEGSIGFLDLWGLCFYTDDTTQIVRVEDCFVNPEGGGLKAGDTTVTLDVSSLNRCIPWNLFELTEAAFCED